MADKKVEKKEETTIPEENLEEKVDAEDEEESEVEESDDEALEDSDQNLDKTDWKKVAQTEQELRKKAEDALAEKRFKTRHKKKDNDDEGDEDEGDEEKPLTPSQLRQLLAEEREATRKEVLSEQTRRYARDLASSDEEAEAIVEIFNNRTFPRGMSHQEQVREAYFIAHGPRLLGKLDESRRALRSKETKSKSGAENTHRDAKKMGEPKLSPQDEAEFKRLGFTWDGKNYIKKLSNGKSLVKDWKTKKTFVR